VTGDEGFSAEVIRQLDLLVAGTDHGDPGLAAAMRRELGERLAEGRPLRVYQGFDPTSPHVHLGHGVGLSKLALFQELGHDVTFLIGDFTARIGDPTGRSATRPALTTEEIAANAQTYADQAFRIMDRARTRIAWNSEWLADMRLADVVRLASSMTLAQVLVREDFRKRLDDGAPIHLHEFLYALLQGEDAAHLGTDVQVGGTDQLFNILAGREVMKARGLRPQVVLTCPLLVGTDGRQKMSKSHGNDIGIAIDPKDMYGKVMSLPDDAMADYWRLASGLPPGEVDEAVRATDSGAWHPRDAKMRLARRIVLRWHGADAAAAAEAAFVQQFQRREVPDDVAPLPVPAGAASLVDLLMATGIPKSRSEARRLVEGGGVSLDGTRLDDAAALPELPDGAVLKVGKRHFFRLAR
jgi:tyrosyl-tRNA synthetase